MNKNLHKQTNDYLLLSCTTKAILLGSLLGDGSLKINKNYLNARFSFRHSIKQKDYFLWKRNQIKQDLSSNLDMWEQKPHVENTQEFQKHKLRYQSKALPSLTYLYNLTLKKNNFCIKRKWLNLMNPLSLAIWWCDAGSLVKNTKQGVFCTDGFLLNDILLLQKYMKSVWNIKTDIYSLKKYKQNGQERFRLWIVSVEELKKFLRIVIPYIPVYSMLYKVIILYKDSELQQRWISEIAEKSKFSLSEIEHIVNLRKSELKAFSGNDIVH